MYCNPSEKIYLYKAHSMGRVKKKYIFSNFLEILSVIFEHMSQFNG